LSAAPSRLPSQLRIEPYVIELERFHGPLDLLLHLIRSQDINIFDVPVARITEQFQAILAAGIERIDLDRAGEFLELAATLIRIKAQLLLPRPGELEWEEDPRAELVRRLLEYEYFQEVAHVLVNSAADRARHFGKGYVETRPIPELAQQDLDLTFDDLLDAAMAILDQVPETRHVAPVRVVTVEEKMSLVRDRLFRTGRLAFRKLFSSWRERPHVVASLLACLELAKQQVLKIEQTERFGSIWLFRTDKRKDVADSLPNAGGVAKTAERTDREPVAEIDTAAAAARPENVG